MLRFVLLAGALWGLFELFFVACILESKAFRSFLSFNAELAGVVIRTLGHEVRVTGQSMLGSGFAMEVKYGCDGIQPVGLFVAILMAFPATKRAKVAGAVLGSLVLLTVNLVRIITLFFTGIYLRKLFEILHADVWQAIFILTALLLWVVWAWWATGDRTRRVYASP